MNLRKNLAEQMKFAMELRNQSLEQFAHDLGIARSSLQCYLAEEVNPRLDTIELISKSLGMSAAELVTGKHPLADLDSLHPLLVPMMLELKKLSDILMELENSEQQ